MWGTKERNSATRPKRIRCNQPIQGVCLSLPAQMPSKRNQIQSCTTMHYPKQGARAPFGQPEPLCKTHPINQQWTAATPANACESQTKPASCAATSIGSSRLCLFPNKYHSHHNHTWHIVAYLHCEPAHLFEHLEATVV